MTGLSASPRLVRSGQARYCWKEEKTNGTLDFMKSPERTMTATRQQTATKSVPAHNSVRGGLLQRKCGCGKYTMGSGKCSECSKKERLGLQLKVNELLDIYEKEAHRIAGRVLATPSHSGFSGIAPRIQRFSGQGQTDTAPATVEQVFANSGRPMESGVREDMEQRFSYEFTRMRVHSGAAAERSAQDISAQAYTVGHDIVFGRGNYAPGTHEGRRLLAHELTHVVQQLGVVDGMTVRQSHDERHPTLLSHQRNDASPVIQCDSVLQRKCVCGNRTAAGAQCAECGRKGEASIQRSAISNQPMNGVPRIVHDALRSPAQWLDTETRGFFGPRFRPRLQPSTGRTIYMEIREIEANAYSLTRRQIWKPWKHN